MSPGLHPRETNIQTYATTTPEGHVTVGAQCFGVDVSVLLRLTIAQSETLRKQMEGAEETAKSLIKQASGK